MAWGTLACAAMIGCLTAPVALADRSDARATWRYLVAEEHTAKTKLANWGASRRAVGALVRGVQFGCPRGLEGAPLGRELDRMAVEVLFAPIYAMVVKRDRIALRVADRTIRTLHWSNGKLDKLVRRNADAEARQPQTPDICRDARAWRATGYTQLAPQTKAFIDAVRHAIVVEGSSGVPELLERYEGRKARLLAVRVKRLQGEINHRFLRLWRKAAKELGRILLPNVYKVPSGSMEPTLRVGSRVLVKSRPPSVGAIVVFHPPEGAEDGKCGPRPHVVTQGGAACDAPVPKESKLKSIKRIVAGPGEEIYIREGHVYRRTSASVAFVREPDPYIRACGSSAECNFPTPIKIPAGHWFLMGDNRGASEDSRFWGPVPTAWIVGVVTRVYSRSQAAAASLGNPQGNAASIAAATMNAA